MEKKELEEILDRIIKKAIASEISARSRYLDNNLDEYEEGSLHTQSTMSLSLIAPAYEYMRSKGDRKLSEVADAMERKFLTLLDAGVLE